MILFQEVRVLVKILSSRVYFFLRNFNVINEYIQCYTMLYNLMLYDVNFYN